MIAALVLASALSSQGGWTVSIRVVDALIPLIESDTSECGRIANLLYESGNSALALRVLDRSGLRKLARRYDEYRRARDVDALVHLASISDSLTKRRAYPSPIRDVLDFPSRETVDSAIQFIAAQENAGKGYDIGWYQLAADFTVSDVYHFFCRRLQLEGLHAEAFYAAAACLDRQKLKKLFEEIPRNPDGNNQRTYSDSMQPMLNELLDWAIAKYPDLLDDDDLFWFAGLPGSSGTLKAAAERLLAAEDVARYSDDPHAWGDAFRRFVGVVARLIEQRQDEMASQVVSRHRPFLIEAFRQGGARLDSKGSRALASLLDGQTVSTIDKVAYQLLTTLDQDNSFPAIDSVFACAQLLYCAGQEERMDRLARLAAEKFPRSAYWLVQGLTDLYVEDGRYRDAIKVGFELSPGDMEFPIGSAIKAVQSASGAEEALFVANLALDKIEETQSQNTLHRSLGLFVKLGLRDRVDKMLKLRFLPPSEANDDYKLLDAVFALAALGDGESALQLFERIAPGSEWARKHTDSFARTLANSVGVRWLFEGGRYERIMDLSFPEPDARDTLFYTLGLMRWSQDDADVFDRLLAQFDECRARIGATDGLTRDLLSAILIAEMPYHNSYLHLDFGYVQSVPPFTVANQDRLLEVINHLPVSSGTR